MIAQRVGFREVTLAFNAHERLFFCMSSLVASQSRLANKGRITVVAYERLYASMKISMFYQSVTLLKECAANVAFKRPLLLVGSIMML